MAPSVGRAIVCPVLVGRDDALAMLRRQIDEARQGQGQSVLVDGEAGVGKSRLVAEMKTYARSAGFRVVQGNCFQPDSACPYAPLLDLLHAHVGSAEELGPGAEALFPLLPDLAPRPLDVAPLDAEQERRRLFAALVHFFLRLAARQPLLVVIEDLHWSDDTSLDWLHLLMRRGADHPLLLLLTYRGEEAPAGLAHWLATLDRERLAKELVLAPLPLGDVEAMLRAIFGLSQPVGRDFLEAIYGLSQGNPFVVEEVLKSLVASGEVVYADGAWSRKPIGRLRIPRSVQDAVHQRCAGLSDDARALLSLAAVAGHRVDFAVLHEITDHDEAALLALIKELIGAQLVVEESADRFAFRHALTRQTIYEDLLARERRALHLTIGEAIERVGGGAGDVRVADLAYHFFEAEAWTKALDYAVRAGERARALYAPSAAIEHLTRAVAATHRLGRTPPSHLYRARGQAYETRGDFEAARGDHETALRLAEAAGDRPAAWQALLDLGFLWSGRDYGQAHAYLQQALELARAMGDPATLAHSLNRMGNWHANHEQPEAARRYHQEALAIFERIEDRPGHAATLDLLGMAAALGGDLVGAMRYGEQAAALFRALDDRQGVVGVLAAATSGPSTIYENATLVGSGTLPGAIRGGEQALTLAREIGWRAGEAFVTSILGGALGVAGDFARALDLLHGSLAIAEEIEHRQWMVQALWSLGGVYADLLMLPTARAHLERALPLARAILSPLWINLVSGGLASVLVAQGELAQAEATLAAAHEPATPMQTPGQRMLWLAGAELVLARDDPAQALAILDRLYATAANLTAEGEIPRLARLKAQALVALRQVEPAEALLQSAQAGTRAEGALAVRWRLHAALGSLYRDLNRRDEAERERATARQIVDRLAANVPEGTLRDGFVRAAMTKLPGPASPSRRRAARDAVGGLTAREREVATWIAQGRTNREIADALFVSERTVEAHVGNILTKLGFASRAQVAAWAVERGLARADT